MGYLTLLAAGIFCALPAFAQSFSIEQVLSAPYPENVTAAPRSDAVAWVQDARGVRNIWMVRSPETHAVQITKFTAEDGQELGDLAFTPDGGAVVFTRGGGPNGRGEFPNPMSNAAGVRQEIWAVSISGDSHKLGDGNSPAISPDGKTVAWIYSGQIYSASLDGASRAAQWIHARGYAGELNWSPDGSALAFTGNRGDHTPIGVYDVRQKTLRWMDPSVDTDRSPVWSADGARLAFIRSPAWFNETGWGQAPRPVGQPWSIRIADVKTGVGREVWRAAEGAGSVFWPMNAAHQLLWASSDRLVFPWERDGWPHLYALELSSKATPALLTPGTFEIEDAGLTPNGDAVIFSSNQGDIDRRHLWSVAISGGTPKRLTPGDGIEWNPTPLKNGDIVLLHSDAKMPARAAVLHDGKVTDLAPETVPADFPASALVDPQPVLFKASDGLELHAQFFLPQGQVSLPQGAGKHPAVIFFHGGPRRQMLLGWHPMQYYNQAYGFNQYLASEGYAVLSVNYRSGIGYGTAFREPLHYGATGAVEFNDALAAAHYLESRNDVDAARIGAWGGSYGGYMTALGLARASNLFKAGVDLHGIHDWNLEFPHADPPRSPEVMKLAFESSPLAAIDRWRSPVLLIQGDDDRNVEFSQTVRLSEALRAHGVPFEQLVFPDEIHDFLLHSDWLKAYHAADEFLARYLKPPAATKAARKTP